MLETPAKFLKSVYGLFQSNYIVGAIKCTNSVTRMFLYGILGMTPNNKTN